MDKIWYRNPSKSEVIGRCGGDEKTEWPRRTNKSQTLKNKIDFYTALWLKSTKQTQLQAQLLNVFWQPSG